MKPFSGEKSPETLDYLLNRRSVPAPSLNAPAPSRAELDTILTAASRVPDHKKLCPWYFLVFEGDVCVGLGETIKDIYLRENPDFKEKRIAIEETRFTRAPLVVAVISRIRDGGAPMWEQILSCGAVCMNMLHASYASGYAAQWLTEWYSFNSEFKAHLGLDERDHIAGFIHIGTPDNVPEDRARPDLSNLVTYWGQGAEIKKGELLNSPKSGLPEAGFTLLKDS